MTQTRSKSLSFHDIAVETKQTTGLTRLMVVISVMALAVSFIAEWLVAYGTRAALQLKKFSSEFLIKVWRQRMFVWSMLSRVLALKSVVVRALSRIGHASSLRFKLSSSVLLSIPILPILFIGHSGGPFFWRNVRFFHGLFTSQRILFSLAKED